MAAERIYKVVFLNQGDVYEVYAKSVAQGGMFGFVEVEGLSFGRGSGVVIDPSQERLETEFDGVERTYIPLHAIIRIDEVAKAGAGRITAAKDGDKENIRTFPTILPPSPSGKDDG